MSSSSVKTVFKNIAPAVVVMVAGLTGAYMVYDSYFNQNVAHYSAIAPASGEAVVTEDADIVVEATVEVTAPTAAECAEAAKAVEEAALEGAVPASDIHVATHAHCIETHAEMIDESIANESATEETEAEEIVTDEEAAVENDAAEAIAAEEKTITPENAVDAATEAAIEAAE